MHTNSQGKERLAARSKIRDEAEGESIYLVCLSVFLGLSPRNNDKRGEEVEEGGDTGEVLAVVPCTVYEI